MKTILLTFLVSLAFGVGLKKNAMASDETLSDGISNPVLQSDDLTSQNSNAAETAGRGGGHPGGGQGGHPGGGHRGGGIDHRGPYHGGYEGGRWHYPNGRVYPVYPRGWGWDRAWYPRWWLPTIIFPGWIWIEEIPVGYWQCTAFNQSVEPFAALGQTENQAAFNALYACGGQAVGCYIPAHFCQFR